MRRFYVGQPIKKVSGLMAVGVTGRFSGPAKFGRPRMDGHVFLDTLAVGTCGEPRDYADIITDQWEPLTPPHEACDPEFAESIRRLTESVSA